MLNMKLYCCKYWNNSIISQKRKICDFFFLFVKFQVIVVTSSVNFRSQAVQFINNLLEIFIANKLLIVLIIFISSDSVVPSSTFVNKRMKNIKEISYLSHISPIEIILLAVAHRFTSIPFWKFIAHFRIDNFYDSLSKFKTEVIIIYYN